VFTDFTYDNLGVPKNPANMFYSMPEEWNADGNAWVDRGLGGFLEKTEEYAQFAEVNYGKHKVPTLRNVDLRPREDFTKAFLHNGYFKTLEDVMHFYNTRDVEGADWPPPEVSANVNDTELGNLEMNEREEELIVLFMKTLSDGFIPSREEK
jgi:cytochrome c peroxidase